MFRTLSNSWQEDLVRERVRVKVDPELYADLFPDHSPLDHPVAEAGARGRGGAGEKPVRSPKFEVRSPDIALLQPSGRLGAGHKQDSKDLRVQIPNSREFRVSNFEFPVSNLQSPVSTFQFPVFNFQFPDSDFQFPAEGLGSNNWVVSGTHTASGKPLLANDPHLGHRVPSVWYMIHLKAPGLDVSGASLPGLPLVVIGHNERVAWGMTNTGPDVQDLYVETFNPQHPKQYRYQEQWVEAEEREETIKVRGARDYQFTARATRHGPVISDLISQTGPAVLEGRALALRWTALDPGALHFVFLALDSAQNWDQFTRALHDYAGPEQNFVYADGDGNIGYYAAGWVPIRKQGDGSMPVPGDSGDYDWAGYIPFEDLPHAYDPPAGIIVTANGRIVPDGYPYFITHRWEAPYRTGRIFQLLEAGSRLTVADMMRIQTDIHALDDEWMAKALIAAGAQHAPETADARYALDLVRNWDGEARADSTATLVCEVTRRTLLERIVKPKLGDDLSGYDWPLRMVFLANVVDSHWTRWLPPGDADFNVTLIKSLEETLRRIAQMARSRDRAVWRWGDTIPLTFHHPLSGGSALLTRLFDVGPFPQAGTANTVKATTSDHGPSMRLVVNLADLDQSVQEITLGESGQVASPYYKDQFDAWYNGTSFPMPFSDAAVDRGTVHKLTFEPEGSR